MPRTGNPPKTTPGTGGGGSSGPRPIARELPPVIQYKFSWASDWRDMPEAELLQVEIATAHGGTTVATFKRRYGDVKLPIESDYPNNPYEPESRMSAWVRVIMQYEGVGVLSEEITFVGRILGDQRVVYNTEDEPATGDQTFTAYGPMEILDRIAVNHSYWDAGGGVEKRIEWLPEVNYRDARRTLLGNRSTDFNADEVYMYGGEELWDHTNYFRYLLYFFATLDSIDPSDTPQWRTAGLTGVLSDIEDDVPLGGTQTVGSIIRRLASPRFGLDVVAYPYYDGGDTEIGFQLEVFALSATGYRFGDNPGAWMPPNQNVVQLNTPYQKELQITVVDSAEQSYDEIEVVGNRVVVCGSAEVGDLKKGWTDALELEYIVASGTFDPDLNDLDRQRPRYRDVYRRVLVDVPAWDFMSNGGLKRAAPKFDEEGRLIPNESHQTQDTVRRTLSWLPLRANVDYSVNPPAEIGDPDVDDDLLAPLGFIFFDYEDAPSSHYYPAEHWGIGVRNVPDALGLYFDAQPNHAMAKADAQDNPFFGTRHHHWYFDWDQSILTFAFESDVRCSLRYRVPPEDASNDGSKLVIEVPGAELWYLAAGTVVGVDDNYGLQRAPESIVLRDDLDRMRLVMAGAIARYYLNRSRAILSSIGFAPWATLTGRVLRVADAGGFANNIESAVTSVVWTGGDGRIGRTEARAGVK